MIMRTNTFTPRAGSVADRTIDFLRDNPQETLSSHEIAVKFDCTRGGVHTLMRQAVEAGVLSRAPDADGELAYRFNAVAQPPAAEPKPKAGYPNSPFVERPKRSPTKYFRTDLSAVPIDRGVVMPPRGAGSGMDWSQLFDRMAPGDSALLPVEAGAVLGKAITDQHKATTRRFLRRQVDGGLRVWRVE